MWALSSHVCCLWNQVEMIPGAHQVPLQVPCPFPATAVQPQQQWLLFVMAVWPGCGG